MNSTFLNGERLETGIPAEIQPGDELRFGVVVLPLRGPLSPDRHSTARPCRLTPSSPAGPRASGRRAPGLSPRPAAARSTICSPPAAPLGGPARRCLPCRPRRPGGRAPSGAGWRGCGASAPAGAASAWCAACCEDGTRRAPGGLVQPALSGRSGWRRGRSTSSTARSAAGEGSGLELVNPSCEPAGRALHGGRIAPVYPAPREAGAGPLRRLLSMRRSRARSPRQVPETAARRSCWPATACRRWARRSPPSTARRRRTSRL